MHCYFIVEVQQDTIRRSLHQIKTPHTLFVSPLLSLSPSYAFKLLIMVIYSQTLVFSFASRTSSNDIIPFSI